MISILEFLRRVPTCPICYTKVIHKEIGAYACGNPKCGRTEYNVANLFRDVSETITTIYLGDVMYRYVHRLQSLTYNHITDKNRYFLQYFSLGEEDFFLLLHNLPQLLSKFPMSGAFIPYIDRYIFPSDRREHSCSNKIHHIKYVYPSIYPIHYNVNVIRTVNNV